MSEMPERLVAGRHGRLQPKVMGEGSTHYEGCDCKEYIRADRYAELRRLAEAVLDCCEFPAVCDPTAALRSFLDSNGGTK